MISEKCAEMGSKLIRVDRSHMNIKKMTLEGTDFDLGEHKDIHIPLLGSYQPLNAANVLFAIDILRELGVKIDEDSVKRGLESVIWHARFEIISKDPLVIADGGHNPEGIDGAVESVKRYFDEKVGIVTGVMADKDYKYMAGRISEVAHTVFCLTPDNPRALPSVDYARVFEELGVPSSAYDTVDEAVASALAWAKENNKPVVCLGSLYMYGEIRRSIDK